MILLIDNYDSFTYNLYQYLGELGEEVSVFRNDKISLEEIESMAPSSIVLSPGPGRPADAGICVSIVKKFAGITPILGICLGHQAIGEAFGGKVIHAPEIFHGKVSDISHKENGIYAGLPQNIQVARYHSLILERNSLPDCFEVVSWTASDLIMGMRHKTLPLEGIQFHPESILTPRGMDMLRNFSGTIS